MKKFAFLALVISLFAGLGAKAQAPGQRLKILIAVTNNSVLGTSSTPTGIHLSELTHPYFAFLDAGYQVDIVSPAGGRSPVDPGSINDEDPANARLWQNPRHRARLDATLPAAAVKPSDYAGIFYVGGHGTMWDFPRSGALARAAAEIYETGGLVAAICHGPAGLLNIRLSDGSYLVTGKRLTSLTNQEEQIGGRMHLMPFLLETELVRRGAIFQPAAPWASQVVVSERLLTAQNPQSVAELSRTFLEVLRQ